MKKDYFTRLIKTKAYLLCYGIRENRHSKRFYRIQNPHAIIKGGYVGLHFLLDNTLPVLASTTFKFDDRSKFEVVEKNHTFYLKQIKDQKLKLLL